MSAKVEGAGTKGSGPRGERNAAFQAVADKIPPLAQFGGLEEETFGIWMDNMQEQERQKFADAMRGLRSDEKMKLHEFHALRSLLRRVETSKVDGADNTDVLAKLVTGPLSPSALGEVQKDNKHELVTAQRFPSALEEGDDHDVHEGDQSEIYDGPEESLAAPAEGTPEERKILTYNPADQQSWWSPVADFLKYGPIAPKNMYSIMLHKQRQRAKELENQKKAETKTTSVDVAPAPAAAPTSSETVDGTTSPVHLNPVETETMLPMGARWVPTTEGETEVDGQEPKRDTTGDKQQDTDGIYRFNQ